MKSLSDDIQANIIEAFNSTSRYLDDLLSIYNLYRRHSELVSKFNLGLITFLRHGLSEPEFYGDLVYKFNKIVGRTDFSFQFMKILMRYERIGYNLNVTRQSAQLVFNPIMVNT